MLRRWADRMAALPVFMYSWGSLRGAPKFRETGLLSGEALVNSLVVNEAFKLVLERERPTLTDGAGKFFNSGPGNSLSPLLIPLWHGPWRLLSPTSTRVADANHGLWRRGAISISRVTGRQHFPSDVVAGGAMGWLIGRQIYRAHHDPDLDGAEYGRLPTLSESRRHRNGFSLCAARQLDLSRAEAAGGSRLHPEPVYRSEPWTRRECLRQIDEAEYFASRPFSGVGSCANDRSSQSRIPRG